MNNLKKFGGTYKGIVGECMFKLTRKYLILTKFFNKNKYFHIFGSRLSPEEKSFLDLNWFSIDALEFDYSKKPRKIVLFEIKSLNDFFYNDLNGINRIPQFSRNSYQMYKKALEKGFDVKVAIVWLKDNWDYEVEIIDFDKCESIITEERRYDKV